jgi:hypothetical protein
VRACTLLSRQPEIRHRVRALVRDGMGSQKRRGKDKVLPPSHMNRTDYVVGMFMVLLVSLAWLAWHWRQNCADELLVVWPGL